MKIFDLEHILIEKFSTYINGMEEIASGKEPAGQKDDQKLFLHVFAADEKADNPLKKISFMLLENGMIKNKDDKTRLDPGEFTVATFIPNDSLPLPMFNMECSIHFEKYIQCRAEIPPMSTNAAYQEAFCRPVQELRQGLEALPGLSPQTTLPGLEEYSSGGLLAGHIELQHKETVLQWFLGYVDLYLSFINKRDEIPVLQDTAIIREGVQRKAAFCRMFSQMTPHILGDLPELYSDELAQKISGLLF